MKTKICFFTGTRADYGIASQLLKKINKSKNFDLHLIASCTHLSSQFGNTIKEIEDDGFQNLNKIKILINTNSKENLLKSAGIILLKFSKILSKIKPNLLILVGDRYETFVAAFCASTLNIPIAHLHGGETTLSSIDDSFRHSITKMSSLHFVANKTYKKRIKQMGENQKNIFNVGSLGVENISNIKLFKKDEVEKKIKLIFKKNNFLVTFHPETINGKLLNKKLPKIFNYLKNIKNTNIVFTSPNSDPGNKLINSLIIKSCRLNKDKFIYIKSMGQKLYFSYLKYCNLVIGNSSSGIIEVPYFKIPTINVGTRQKGRLEAISIINTGYDFNRFKTSINKALSKDFLKKIQKQKNPYYKINTSDKILAILNKKNYLKDNFVKKIFYDYK